MDYYYFRSTLCSWRWLVNRPFTRLPDTAAKATGINQKVQGEPMISGRFVLYGAIASEHEDGNLDMDPSYQRVGGTSPLYATDDREEAMDIYRAGGFGRQGKWYAVTWARDTQTGHSIGAVPEGD
jgi:hypothetical protein